MATPGGTNLGSTVTGGTPVLTTPGSTSQGAQGGTTPGGTGQGSTGASSPYGDLTGADRDAAAFLTDEFSQYGLGTLAPKIIDYLKQGFSSDTIAIMLQGTDEYKARFAGNTQRLKDGLPVLNPAQYLAVEDSYRQIMASAGLPAGFYDSQDDFAGMIGKDVSPTELQGRVQVASNLINSLDPATTQKFSQFYGGQGSLVAYALDQKIAEPLLEKQFQAAQIAAADQGLGVSQTQAEQLAGQGISQSQASAGFGNIGVNLHATQNLANIYGGAQYTLQDAMDETFGNNAEAALKRQRLVAQEQAAFTGTTGVGQGSLAAPGGGQF